jgi:hypothetical protein
MFLPRNQHIIPRKMKSTTQMVKLYVDTIIKFIDKFRCGLWFPVYSYFKNMLFVHSFSDIFLLWRQGTFTHELILSFIFSRNMFWIVEILLWWTPRSKHRVGSVDILINLINFVKIELWNESEKRRSFFLFFNLIFLISEFTQNAVDWIEANS